MILPQAQVAVKFKMWSCKLNTQYTRATQRPSRSQPKWTDKHCLILRSTLSLLLSSSSEVPISICNLSIYILESSNYFHQNHSNNPTCVHLKIPKDD